MAGEQGEKTILTHERVEATPDPLLLRAGDNARLVIIQDRGRGHHRDSVNREPAVHQDDAGEVRVTALTAVTVAVGLEVRREREVGLEDAADAAGGRE